MSNINQYRARIEHELREELGINIHINPQPIRDVVATTPNYIDNLIETYGFSQSELDRDVFRIGIGKKLGRNDSDIYDDISDLIDQPTFDENIGIICPRGILVFYEDIVYRRGGDAKLLAASYHFQTPPQSTSFPLYFRFEYDPILIKATKTDDERKFEDKPVFHYHFSNYDLFHKHCHFPAGYFEVAERYPSNSAVLARQFMPQDVPGLAAFLRLLRKADLIAS